MTGETGLHQPLPYVLVAEASVLPTINVTLEALRLHAEPSDVFLVIPRAQHEVFKKSVSFECKLVPEEEVVSPWTAGKVSDSLINMKWRAGWYLQQFLKLSFGTFARVPSYVVWDADTVLLEPFPLVGRDGRSLINTSREYHKPYFATFEKLLGFKAMMERSAIAQFMLFETEFVSEMQRLIEARNGRGWIEAVLAALPGKSGNEFSEYETYANFMAANHPDRIDLQRLKWFRYGSEILMTPEQKPLSELKRLFPGYAYVAFERHGGRIARTVLAHAMLLARIGS